MRITFEDNSDCFLSKLILGEPLEIIEWKPNKLQLVMNQIYFSVTENKMIREKLYSN